MTTSPTEAAAAPPNAWVLRRADPGGEEYMPGDEPGAGDSGLGFGDLLDVINPLQHLPVVGTIYRALTGDSIGDAARMAGGALYGGPLGIVGALANVIFERENGQDIGQSALAWLSGGEEAGADAAGEAIVADAQAQPINAAPVTTAAANASPAAFEARAEAAANRPDPVRQAALLQDRAARATTNFQGRSADRLDAFIQQASAVRRDNPLAAANRPGGPGLGAIDPARLQAAALKPPGMPDRPDAEGGSAGRASTGEPGLTLAGGDAGSVNEWMLRALDKYEHMRKQETS